MQRLDRILSEAGVASRKELRAIIRAGRVRVDGALVTDEARKFDETAACITVDGAQYRYVLAGNEGAQTLVLLNGGMNTLAMWMDYVDDLARDFRVLLFDYPQELRTNQALVTGMHAFFKKLRVEKPVFIVDSDGNYCDYYITGNQE